MAFGEKGREKNRKGFKKKSEKKASKLIVADIVVIGLCFACTVLSGVGLLVNGKDYTNADKEYERLGELVELNEVNAEGNVEVSDLTFKINWEQLRAINSEIVAWIIVPGTPINYPVVQTNDNTKYLHMSFEGANNICGTVFMNTYNHSDFSDYNTVIYGHNMKNGSMFAAINKYKNKDYYDEHQVVWILTPYWERKYQIISVHPAEDGSETYTVEFAEGMYEQHVASEVSQSIYDTGTGFNKEMPMVTLSTCRGRGLLDRMVLVCQPVYETKINPFIVNETSGVSVNSAGATLESLTPTFPVSDEETATDNDNTGGEEETETPVDN